MDGMSGIAAGLAGIYGFGVLVGLMVTDARPAARIGLALAWPIGPLAFALTIALLLAATPVAFFGKR